MKIAGNLTIVIAMVFSHMPVALSQELSFTDNGEGIYLKKGDRDLFFFQKKTKTLHGSFPRADYIHPLYGLNGEVLTEDFPDDHLHQRGVYWAWHQLFVEGEKIGDPWACEGIEWSVEKVTTMRVGNEASLRASLYWIGHIPGHAEESQRLIRENTLINYTYLGPELRIIDFDIKLTALHDGTRIGGSDDEKGYSGFSIRIKMPDDIRFASADGKVIPRETAVQAGGWMDISGTFDENHEQQTCVTIMCDPDRPSPFHGWILRNRGSMQNAAFPGRTPVPIRKDETLFLKYRILLHRSDLTAKDINSIYREFLAGKETH